MERFVIMAREPPASAPPRSSGSSVPTILSPSSPLMNTSTLAVCSTSTWDMSGPSRASIFVGEDFFEKKNIFHIPCQTVSRIDTEAKLVYYGEDYSVPYDKLLIATGSGFFIPPIPTSGGSQRLRLP